MRRLRQSIVERLELWSAWRQVAHEPGLMELGAPVQHGCHNGDSNAAADVARQIDEPRGGVDGHEEKGQRVVLWAGVGVIPLAAERVEVDVVAGSRLARLDNYPGSAEVVGEVVEERGKLV